MSADGLTARQSAFAQFEVERRRRASQRFATYYPDCTDACKNPASTDKADHVAFCRALYGRQLDFFRAGAKHRERLFLGANRSGKTETAAYEITCHATGRYPHWWRGRRFEEPITAWLVGDTMLTTRNVLQVALMGPIDGIDVGRWTGMIPPELVVGKPTRKSGGVNQCLDTVRVRHASGGVSALQFMSYDQGRRAFQGTSRMICLLDEEPPDNEDIYGECLTRTLDVNGMVMMTFTPLRGYTAFLSQWCETAVYLDRDGSEVAAAGVFGVQA